MAVAMELCGSAIRLCARSVSAACSLCAVFMSKSSRGPPLLSFWACIDQNVMKGVLKFFRKPMRLCFL